MTKPKAEPPVAAATGQSAQSRREPPALMEPGSPPPKVKPMTVKDPATGLTFYFEKDGQTIAAIKPDGSILWHRNPIAERGVKGWTKDGRVLWPTIYFAAVASERSKKKMTDRSKPGDYLDIGFTTKEFGVLNEKTGEFTSFGSD